MKKHGITIREIKSNKLVDFIECSVGQALKVLSGVRQQMDSTRFKASEEFITLEESKKV